MCTTRHPRIFARFVPNERQMNAAERSSSLHEQNATPCKCPCLHAMQVGYLLQEKQIFHKQRKQRCLFNSQSAETQLTAGKGLFNLCGSNHRSAEWRTTHSPVWALGRTTPNNISPSWRVSLRSLRLDMCSSAPRARRHAQLIVGNGTRPLDNRQRVRVRQALHTQSDPGASVVQPWAHGDEWFMAAMCQHRLWTVRRSERLPLAEKTPEKAILMVESR